LEVELRQTANAANEMAASPQEAAYSVNYVILFDEAQRAVYFFEWINQFQFIEELKAVKLEHIRLV
jgi:hypothetical protein